MNGVFNLYEHKNYPENRQTETNCQRQHESEMEKEDKDSEERKYGRVRK